MENIINLIIKSLNGTNKELIVFIISLLPILELRGGLLAASLLHLEFKKAFIVCIIGNIIPIPLVLLFIEKIFNKLENIKITKNLVKKLKDKALSKREQIDKFGYLGLLLFVGIPLPGTGAWTGSLLAILLGLNRKKSFIYIILGVILASIIMSIISYGILGTII